MDTVASPAPETEFPRIGILDTLIGVIFRPYRAFEQMRSAERGHWWVVVILALISLAIFTFVQTSNSAGVTQAASDAQLEQMELSPEEQAQVEQAQSVMNDQLIIAGFSCGFLAVVLLLGYVIRAALLLVVGLLFGGRADFKQVFRMSVWTTLPDVFRYIVGTVMMLVTGGIPAQGFSYILTDAEYAAGISTNSILVAFLGQIDVYWLWSVILIMLGVAVTYKISRTKGLLIALIYWLITLGFTLGVAALGQAVSGLAPG